MTDTIVDAPTRDAQRDNVRRSVEFRAEASPDGLTLDGYGATFGDWTEIYDRSGSFMEQIAPGAFKRTIGQRTPVLQFDHGAHPLIGSIPLGRITSITEDGHGLRVKARLSDNWLVEPVRDAIRDGAVTGMSFRFRVVSDQWESRDGTDYRTITEVELYEVGPVVFPAYESTTVGVRSRQTALALTDPEVRREVASLLTLGTEDIRALADESPAITDAPDEVHASDVTTPADGHVKTRTKNQRRAIVAGISAQGGTK
jgi:HK97 family phage prohead protease